MIRNMQVGIDEADWIYVDSFPILLPTDAQPLKACDITEGFCYVIEAGGVEAIDPEGPHQYAKDALTPLGLGGAPWVGRNIVGTQR